MSTGRNDDLSNVYGGLDAVGVANGFTAKAGGGQLEPAETDSDLAYVLPAGFVRITTAATAGDSVQLPAAVAIGTKVQVQNEGAASANVFPAKAVDGVGDTIDGAAVDTAVAVAASSSATFIKVAENDWRSVL